MADRDDETSQPVISTVDPLATLANAVVALREQQSATRALVKEARSAINFLRDRASEFVTRSELERHVEKCPALAAGGRNRPTTGEQRTSWWSGVQLRLGAIVSLVTLVAMLGAAWFWTARTYGALERQIKTERRESREQFRTDLKKLIKRLDKIDRKVDQ